MQVATTTDGQPIKLCSETRNMIILTEAKNYADTEILKTFEFIEKYFIEVRITTVCVIQDGKQKGLYKSNSGGHG